MQNKSIGDNIPLIGIIIFVAIYMYSSTLYPGGSQEDLQVVGYDWIHNYWCNLMNDQAINGQSNPAKPFAVVAMVILCLSLLAFFIQFATFFVENSIWKSVIIWCGSLSMFLAMFIFTSYHDLMTTLSSIFGLFVVIGIIRKLYISGLRIYKVTGLICLLLLGLNNFIYYTQHFMQWLPLLQKITFGVVLIWIIGLNNLIIKKKRNKNIS